MPKTLNNDNLNIILMQAKMPSGKAHEKVSGSVRESLFWADQIARKVAERRKKGYVCAAGITPSGVVHIGNCREIMTVDIVARALKSLGKDVRFIYSWDDYDRLRKVPKNIPEQESTKQYLMKPIIFTPDPWGCHGSYAEHFEKAIEDVLPRIGVRPEFIRQNEMYRKCAYADGIRTALEKRDAIRSMLNKYRKDPLPVGWYPVRIYCSSCGMEETKVVSWDGKFQLSYSCACGFGETFDFREKGIVKLQWRVDWPMRWHHEQVDFEPGGKEHSTPGGSRTTAAEISRQVYGYEPPVYQMYDYIIIRGEGGKMSSSLGNVITLDDVLNVYLPEIARYFFAGTKPAKEFAFSFGEDVFKLYEDFYKVERIYYGKEPASERDSAHWSRVYEMSCTGVPAKGMPCQPGFRQCVDMVSAAGSADKACRAACRGLSDVDAARWKAVLERAEFWLSHHAPDRYKAVLKSSVDDSIRSRLTGKQKAALKSFAEGLGKAETEEDVKELCSSVSKGAGIRPDEFFTAAYLVILGSEKGPRLAPFVLAAGKDKIIKLLNRI